MKLKLSKVMFINLVFRILLIIYLLRDSGQEKKQGKKPLQYWLDPISNRVFLIFINGLQADFLEQNSTPFLRKVVETFGCYAVARSSYWETNLQGLRTVLTGRYGPTFPFSLLSTYCEDSILDYVPYKCGVGQIPEEISMPCYIPDTRPLETSLIFPKLLTGSKFKSSLILMNFDLDPVLMKDYQKRLRKMDGDVRFLSEVMGRAYVDNKTTYIVTSARGAPIEGSLSIDSPVIAWGNGIADTDEITFLGKADLTAMLCVLLGINFPSRLFGVVPANMLKLKESYEYDLNLYTIKHFERVLEAVDPDSYVVESSELEVEQLDTRLDQIIAEIKKKKVIKVLQNGGMLILLLLLWGFNHVLFTSSGYAYFFLDLKWLVSLLLLGWGIVATCSFQPDLIIMLAVMLFWTWQNGGQIQYFFCRKVLLVLLGIGFTFVAVTVVGIAGSKLAIRLFLVPVIIWPVLQGAHKRLNRFVLYTRVLTGIVLCALPCSKTFGDSPNNFFLTTICFLFLIFFYFLLRLFKRQMDAYLKINFLMIFLTILSYRLPSAYSPFRDVILCFLLAFSFLVVLGASGTLLSRLVKIFLPLFIPVLLLSIRIESLFYLSIVFHLFTWIFTEYHSKNLIEYRFYSSVFSVQPKSPLKSVRFSEENIRHVVFFLIYCYSSYFAIGHFPDLHSYDMYVVPTFIYDYPRFVSYFLGGFKFFLPFFLVTMSFITICGLKDMDFKQMITASMCFSDLIGCFLVFYSQFFNILSQRTVFPVKLSYFTILQFANVSVILSSFFGEFLLLSSDAFFQRIFRRNKVTEQNV